MTASIPTGLLTLAREIRDLIIAWAPDHYETFEPLLADVYSRHRPAKRAELLHRDDVSECQVIAGITRHSGSVELS